MELRWFLEQTKSFVVTAKTNEDKIKGKHLDGLGA